MKVEFLASFSKDIDTIRFPVIKKALERSILEVEKAPDIRYIRNVKKLRGSKTAYRIRIGDYRIGIFYESGIIQFARVVHRKDIYKVFP